MPSKPAAPQDNERENTVPIVDNTPANQELFGPGSGIFATPDEDEQCPDEIREIFDQNEFGNQRYECTLKQITNMGSAYTYVKHFMGQYPSYDWLVKNCGPGEYELSFKWRQKAPLGDPENRKYITVRKSAIVSISDKCKREYVDFQFKKRLNEFQDQRAALRDAQLERLLEVEMKDLGIKEVNPAQVPAVPQGSELDKLTENVSKIAQIANALGMSREPAKPAFDFGQFLPLLPAVITFFQEQSNRRAEEQKALYALLLSNASSNNNQLLELFKAQQGPTSGGQMMKEMMEMIRGAIDLKAMMAPEKESLADKVFKMIESVSPMIMGVIAAKQAGGAQAIAAAPMITAAKTYVSSNPDIQAAMSDPVERRKVISNLDGFFGWEQADIVLQVMGYERPPECARNPWERYPADDPRNPPRPNDIVEPEAAQSSSAPYQEPDPAEAMGG